MADKPLVSVVVIFFNAEQFIQEAIDSVFAQTCRDWELLLVDDGSTDESTEIARRIAQEHIGRVRYLEHTGHQNRGMSAARNLGVYHATGEYIAFLDADDVWFPNTLEEQVTLLESHPEAALVYGPIQYWFSWTGKPEDCQRDYVEGLGVRANSLVKPPRLLPLFLLDRAAVPSGMLVRRAAIERAGGFEEAFRGEYEDQVFCAKICLHEPVFASDRCWYRYRQHEGSAVAAGMRTGQTYSARFAFLTWLAQYLSEQSIKDPRVWWAWQREYLRYKHPRLFRLSQRLRQLEQRMAVRLRTIGEMNKG